MPGVGRVTVSLRRSMIASGMMGIILGFAAMFHVPATVDFPEKDGTVVHLLETHGGTAVVGRPFAVVEEAAELLRAVQIEAAWVSLTCSLKSPPKTVLTRSSMNGGSASWAVR